MAVDTLHTQIGAALKRFAQLQRRSDQLAPDTPRILADALRELQGTLEELHAMQRRLLEQRELLAMTRSQLERERRRYTDIFDAAPDAYVVTGADGTIADANRAAAGLFNTSQRFLVGKAFTVFLNRDRDAVMTRAAELAEHGGHATWVLDVRPRERAPITVIAKVACGAEGPSTLRWILRRQDDVATGLQGDTGSSEN